jgi:hypothetical protein
MSSFGSERARPTGATGQTGLGTTGDIGRPQNTKIGGTEHMQLR